MDALILLALVVGPAAGTYALRKTPVFWAPSAVLLILGSAELGGMYGVQRHRPDALAARASMYGCAFCAGYALVCLVAVLAYRRAARRRPPAVEPPPGAGVSEQPKI